MQPSLKAAMTPQPKDWLVRQDTFLGTELALPGGGSPESLGRGAIKKAFPARHEAERLLRALPLRKRGGEDPQVEKEETGEAQGRGDGCKVCAGRYALCTSALFR